MSLHIAGNHLIRPVGLRPWSGEFSHRAFQNAIRWFWVEPEALDLCDLRNAAECLGAEVTEKGHNRDLRRRWDAGLLKQGANLLHEPAMRLLRLPHLADSDALSRVNADHVVLATLGDSLTSAELVGYGPVLLLVRYDLVPLHDYDDRHSVPLRASLGIVTGGNANPLRSPAIVQAAVGPVAGTASRSRTGLLRLGQWPGCPHGPPVLRQPEEGAPLLFFSLSDWVLVLVLFAIIFGATAGGLMAGRRLHDRSDTLRESIAATQAALLGFMALILAFGLTLAVGRYQDRRATVVEEANAIGTTYLRAQTLAEPIRSRSLGLLVRYTDASVRLAQSIPDTAAARQALADGAQIQRELWSLAGQALDAAPVASVPGSTSTASTR